MFPTPFGPQRAVVVVQAARIERDPGPLRLRKYRCPYATGSRHAPCNAIGAWRIEWQFVVGHLCEMHRDVVAREEGPRGIEAWLRELGVRVAPRFPPIGAVETCDYAPRSDRAHACGRVAGSVEIVDVAYEVCDPHHRPLVKALASARKRPSDLSPFRFWWWD